MTNFRLLPWSKLTRNGVPRFRVSRRPMTTLATTFEVGAELPVGAVANQSRLRQLYEQRAIEPISDSVEVKTQASASASAKTHREPESLSAVPAPPNAARELSPLPGLIRRKRNKS